MNWSIIISDVNASGMCCLPFLNFLTNLQTVATLQSKWHFQFRGVNCPLVILSPPISVSRLRWISFYIPSHSPFSLYLCLCPWISQQEPCSLKAMRYLSIFLSGEYFILPFKHHFHTERVPVSRSGFTHTLCRGTSLFQPRWQSVCTFQEGFWSENADRDYEFLYQRRLMKKAWSQTVVIWHGATDDRLQI